MKSLADDIETLRLELDETTVLHMNYVAYSNGLVC